ncbi:MAG: hypothetical protein AABY11_00365, partial [archaeon]
DNMVQLAVNVSNLSDEQSSFESETNTKITELEKKNAELERELATSRSKIHRSRVYEEVAEITEKTVFCHGLKDVLLDGYCVTGSFGEKLPSSVALFDNFSDLQLTSNPTWGIYLGDFVVGTSPAGPEKLVAVGIGLHDMSTPTPFTSNSFSMEMSVMPNQTSDQLYIGVSDSPGRLIMANDNGYMVGALTNYSGTDAILLYRIDQGVFTVLKTFLGMPLPIGSEQIIRAERDSAGFWTIYHNNVPFPTGIQDLTHQTFLYTHIRYNSPNNGGSFDNVKVEFGSPGTLETGYKNVNNLNRPMGVECNYPGVARILCVDNE